MKFNANFDIENTKKVDVKFAEGSAKTSVKNHDELLNRDLPNQHPISSITGLEEKFENYLKNEELSVAVDNALATAKESGLFDGKDGVDGKDGRDGIDGRNGVDGKNGIDGKDGYTPIKGIDYFDGKDGKDGKDGTNGTNGRDGYTPIKGIDYKDGVDGKDGANGKDGIDGKTPVKGTDYFTETDKAEMVQAVISLLPIYDGEVVAV